MSLHDDILAIRCIAGYKPGHRFAINAAAELAKAADAEIARLTAELEKVRRVPLTKDQIDEVLDKAGVPEYQGCEGIDVEIARAIERAHGIEPSAGGAA